MNKILIIALILSFAANANAQQPWFPSGNGPVRLQDAVKAYKDFSATKAANSEDNEDTYDAKGLKIEKENDNYQFDRWLWYWKNHTDKDGYLVSPIKPWQDWQSYMQQIAKLPALAKTTGVSANWSFQGPTQPLGGNSGIGRINVIAFDPVDQNTFWIGSAGGGIWKTSDYGGTWTPMYNNLPLLGVSDIDINPLNSNTMYICTGDGDGNDTYSIGVFKSTDGGHTWDTTGLKWNTSSYYFANALVINPLDTNTLLLASNNGIYRSLDAGAHWTRTIGGNFKQIVYNPADTNIVMACSYYGANIYRSADGGATWHAVTNIAGVIRGAIAVTPANPAIVKAIFAISPTNSNRDYGLEGIYSSSDSGKTFVKIFSDSGCTRNILNGSSNLNGNTCGGQGWYDLCMTISPTDSNKLLIGGVNTYQSTNGGYQWSIVTQWTSTLPGVKLIHADKHFMAYNPLQPSVLYQCNDGGVFRSTNTTSVWTDISNGLGITQFYRIALSNIAPYVIGGAQDNGTKLVRNGLVTQLTGADGMNCQMDYADSNTFYTASQYGSINRSQDHGAHYANISNNISSPAPTGAWVTPYVIHPQLHSALFAGYDRLYLSTDFGQTWNTVSPVFAPGIYIDRIAVAYHNPNNIFVLVGNGLNYTTDFGSNWTYVYDTTGATISDIIVDPKNDNIVWVTYSGYGNRRVGQFSLLTHRWSFFTGTLPDIPVNCIAIDSTTSTVYLGTDNAVFYKDTTMSDWALFNTNLPNVMIDDIAINYTTSELWVATFGRGFWKSPKHDQSATGISVVPYAMDVINVSPNPNNGHFTVTTACKELQGHNVELRLVNSAGITAWQGTNNFSAGGTMNVNAQGLTRGIYILEVSGNNTTARARIVIF